jgi:ferredoxin
MPVVTFISSDGQVKKFEATAGKTILQIALDHGVPMEHACGGNGFCTTCMCDIDGDMTKLSPRNDREENMGITDDPRRLGCQAEVMGDVTVKMLDE